MSASRHSIVSGSTKEFPPFRLDTVNECLWRHRGRRLLSCPLPMPNTARKPTFHQNNTPRSRLRSPNSLVCDCWNVEFELIDECKRFVWS
jgi:hypothetical protein